jgi:hypothetical protein
MQPDLPADAGVGRRQDAQRHDEHGHAVPGERSTRIQNVFSATFPTAFNFNVETFTTAD